MSEEGENYDDEDFENYYEEDFEDDGELEVPQQKQQEQQPLDSSDGSTVLAARLDSSAWPSLAGGRSLHGKGPTGAPIFSRSLLPGSHQAPFSSTSRSTTCADVSIILQPPPPPLTYAQRAHACKALQRSQQLQRKLRLQLSTQLDLLTLHPMSLYQQYSQAMGVYARVAVAACQTRQLDQEIREQDAQTDEIEVQGCACQVPDDLHSSKAAAAAAAPGNHKAAASKLLTDLDPALAEYLEWAEQEMLFELGRAAAAAAAEGRLTVAGLKFGAVASSASVEGSSHPLLVGEMSLQCKALLAGRLVVDVAGPPTSAAAASAAAAINAVSSAADATVSGHLLLSCCSPVQLPAEAALKEHGIAGLGCLCVWDLAQVSTLSQQDKGMTSSNCTAAQGLVQVLVSEGRPSCCCWGAGESSCLVFAGLEEGGICCWDLSDSDSSHPFIQIPSGPLQAHDSTAQQPQQQHCTLAARRPAYSTEMPFMLPGDDSIGASMPSSSSLTSFNSGANSWLSSSYVGGDSVVALAVVPPSSSNVSGASAAAAGGSACQLVAVTGAGCVTLYSVMLGGAGSGIAISDLGMRTGSRLWLVKMCENLPLGLEALKPPHLRRTALLAAQAVTNEAAAGKAKTIDSNGAHSSSRCIPVIVSSMTMLPGSGQQLLVGVDGGRLLKGACLGTTSPPHEYVAEQWWPLMQPSTALKRHRLDSDGSDTATTADNGISAISSKRPPALLDSPERQPDGQAGLPRTLPGCQDGSKGVVGSVTSIAVCPTCPDAWLTGHSCGCVAVFAANRSRPVVKWQHPWGVPIVAVRWLPARPCAFIALFAAGAAEAGGCLMAFDLAVSTRQPAATALITKQLPQQQLPERLAIGTSAASYALPCCMEVLVIAATATTMPVPTSSPAADAKSRGSQGGSRTASALPGLSNTAAGAAAGTAVVVGFSDGSSSVYKLAPAWSQPSESQLAEIDLLQRLLESYV